MNNPPQGYFRPPERWQPSPHQPQAPPPPPLPLHPRHAPAVTPPCLPPHPPLPPVPSAPLEPTLSPPPPPAPSEPVAPPPPPDDPAPAPPAPREEAAYDVFAAAEGVERTPEVMADIATPSVPPAVVVDTLNRDKEEHFRRVEAENRKRRKLLQQHGHAAPHIVPFKRACVGTGSSFNVFGDDEEEEDDDGPARHSSAAAATRGQSESTTAPLSTRAEMDSELEELVVKTASWAAKNSDKLSPPGLRFTEEFKRVQAELVVRQVCSGPESSALLSGPALSDSQASQLQSAIRAAATAVASSQPHIASKVRFNPVSDVRPARKSRWGPPTEQTNPS